MLAARFNFSRRGVNVGFVSGLPPAEEIATRVVELCEALASLEFSTFVVGVRPGRAGQALPEADLMAWKSAVKRAAGIELWTRWNHLGRRVEFDRPEVVFVFDLERERVERRVRSVFVYGRYRKLARGLPQTRATWKCPACSGSGCERCGGTGRRYPTSVEDLLGGPLAEAFGGAGYQLHGLGREDIDVLCLGSGRPFVLEVRGPVRRQADLDSAAQAVEAEAGGKLELPRGLRLAPEDLVPRVKGWEADKVYRARCEALGEADLEAAAVAGLEEELTGALLEQRTPLRVSRRRADKVRRRRIVRFQARALEARSFEAEVEAQSGTYIKELVSGDEGRTRPSVAGVLGVPCVCAELDVLEVRVEDSELLGPS